MTDMTLLTDTEIAAVAGGAITQTIGIGATQSNTSTVTQTATATNYGSVSASTGAGNYNTAAAVGASASNFADVSQANIIAASNSIRFGHH